MKNKKKYIIIAIIVIAILTFVIPVRNDETYEATPVGVHYYKNYYNLYNIKIWQQSEVRWT